MALFTCTVLSMLLFTTLFTHTKWWRGIDRWCGIDWWGVTIPLGKILMHCWSVTWQHVSSGPKNHAYGTCIYTWLFSTKPRHCSIRLTIQIAWSNRVLLTDDVAQSWASKLFLIRWPWFTPCIYKNEALPPNWVSLNSFLSLIFCNSFSILYFLRILINFHFTPSSIMSS